MLDESSLVTLNLLVNISLYKLDLAANYVIAMNLDSLFKIMHRLMIKSYAKI